MDHRRTRHQGYAHKGLLDIRHSVAAAAVYDQQGRIAGTIPGHVNNHGVYPLVAVVHIAFRIPALGTHAIDEIDVRQSIARERIGGLDWLGIPETAVAQRNEIL